MSDWLNPQNSACGIVTHRRDTSLICTFLREVWGGGKGEGNVPSVRASTQPDTTVCTVRFCTLYTKVFSRSKSRLCPFYILVWYLLWLGPRNFKSSCPRAIYSKNPDKYPFIWLILIIFSSNFARRNEWEYEFISK